MIKSTDLYVCRLQGEIFEKSLEMVNCGSASFIRNFMNSNIVAHIDSSDIGIESISINQIYKEYFNQYGNRSYGKKKYSAKALYWIGYTYRYWNKLYNQTSKSIYKTINGKEMNDLYLPYHTFSSEKAIQRIIDSKGQTQNDEYLMNAMRKVLNI